MQEGDWQCQPALLLGEGELWQNLELRPLGAPWSWARLMLPYRISGKLLSPASSHEHLPAARPTDFDAVECVPI